MVKIRLARTGEGQDPSEAARELLVSALENEYGIPAAEVRIEKDEKGKPYLEGYPDLYLSISHSGPYIACAFGDKPVGVDTEMWKAHPKWRRIVDKMHLREREAFGLGMGGMQATCGAVSGAVMLAGLKNSCGDLEAPVSKGKTYQISKQLVEAFHCQDQSLCNNERNE